ncbi:uncharacterized protein TRAVEDRAFT_49841 [Trametes versicolor FP-101664 SS1]|uniref:uncharacterized protein n=1 Tax=Trametes versicolor (strain FP-101664) TaxID=717944 RepID=UPI00046222F2|nr:uncharacterized protein TRAVEDRAFT_49841 [Trametes versicolor FP-101664 SS1]EIW57029.1 hypothetical protein TRAVEDRAFT_49841 [Trametes versicolor FP-101664 SS1]
MSSVSASDAGLISFYQDTRTINNVDVAIAMFLAYDALLCIDKEIQYVWRSPKTSRKLSPIIYMYNRYMALLRILVVLSLVSPVSDAPQIFALIIPITLPALTTLRVYALSGKNKTVTGVVLLLRNVYFCTLVSLNIVEMTMAILTVLARPYEIENVFLPLIDPISSILNSRFLLELYETTAHRERGGPSLSSFSLDFGQAFPSGGAPSDLPEFLSEFAGPIHPGMGYGPVLYDAESEPEAEVRVHAGLGADGSSGYGGHAARV